MKGKKRCRLHGGKTPASQNAGATNNKHKHGLYSSALNDEERVLWAEMQLGTVDDELRLCRIRLHRAVHLEANIATLPNDVKNMAGFELSEMRKSAGENGSSVDIISKRTDTTGVIDRLLGRIAQLEKTRAELIAAQSQHGDGDGMPLPWVD